MPLEQKKNKSNYMILWCVVALLVIWRGIGHYPWFYTGHPIHGVLHDKNTGLPVSRAIAVLQFSTTTSKFHGTSTKVIHIDESVTDERGRYSFESWGPKFNSFGFRPREYSPTITFFKKGFKVAGITNASQGKRKFNLNFVPSHSPAFMEKYRDLNQELEILQQHRSLMEWSVGQGMKCFWEKVPNFMIENDARNRNYFKHLPPNKRYILPVFLSEWTKETHPDCTDPKTVFGEYLTDEKNLQWPK